MENFNELYGNRKIKLDESFQTDNSRLVSDLIKSANTFTEATQTFKDDLWDILAIARKTKNIELYDYIYKIVLPKLPELLSFSGIMVKLSNLITKEEK